jgi:hypothetical protein
MSTVQPDPNGQQDSFPQHCHPVQTAGPENLARLEGNLWRNKTALQYLFDRGITPTTIRKFHLGIKEPYKRKADERTVSNVLCYPLISSTGEALSHYGCYAMPGVTENALDEGGWGRGRPRTYYSGSAAEKTILLVTDSCYELWVLDQHLIGTGLEDNSIVISPSHGSAIPSEWKSPEFWSRWSTIYFVQHTNASGEQIARDLSRFCGRDVLRVRVPEAKGQSWVEFFLSGGTGGQFVELIKSAPVLSGPVPMSGGVPDQLGEFAVNPVNINGAFVNGFLYYPFTVERREMEQVERRGRESARRFVTSYVTKIVRSDGAVLDIVRLAAPRGTPHERQVLALTDGTRIEKEPQPSYYATWQLDSIQAFITAMQGKRLAPHRPLGTLLVDVIAHLRRSVWLPYDEDYVILALYVALSFVYQVFEAIPLLMVKGEKGTGKSELGDALSRVSCNATIVGQGSAASLIRLLNEARGLVVLDDLESIGRVLEDTAFGDVNQMLKLGYKKRTGRKTITDKSGKTTVFDFYGPKVVNNTRGSDSILGSRMLHIQTRHIPDAVHRNITLTGSEPEELMQLRNELHAWGMAEAKLIYERYSSLLDAKHDRQGEISAPLRAIAQLSGDENIQSSLELALKRQHARRRQSDNPTELLKEAINNCIRRGATEQLSAFQILLELRLLAEENASHWSGQSPPNWLRPEWVGHQLRTLGMRDHRLKVKRVRLYGIITRVYHLRAEYVRTALDGSDHVESRLPARRDPLGFCENTLCSSCPYDKVCALTIRGLQTGKRLSKGKSGRKHLEPDVECDASQRESTIHAPPLPLQTSAAKS